MWVNIQVLYNSVSSVANTLNYYIFDESDKLVVTRILIAADVEPTNYFYDLCNNFSSFEEGSYRIQISRDHWTMSNSININIVDPPIVN